MAVGKLKNRNWKAAAEHYLELIRRWRPVEVFEARDGASELNEKERVRQEGARILQRLGADKGIALANDGKMFSSGEFAAFLGSADASASRYLTFIIGGPFGLDEAVLRQSRFVLSLSAMTWPHELARVLLLEQIYRGESILRQLPYHHS